VTASDTGQQLLQPGAVGGGEADVGDVAETGCRPVGPQARVEGRRIGNQHRLWAARGGDQRLQRVGTELAALPATLEFAQPRPGHQPLGSQPRRVDTENLGLGQAEGQHRQAMVTQPRGDGHEGVGIDFLPAARFGPRGFPLKTLGPGEPMMFDMALMDFMNMNGSPPLFGQVPVVAGQLVPHPCGDSRWTEQVEGARRDMGVAHQVVEPHEMVHVGMADEHRVDGAQGALGQMVQLPAVEQQTAPGRPYPYQQQRVVEEAGAEIRLDGMEQAQGGHGDC